MSSTSVSVAGPMQGWGIVQTLGGRRWAHVFNVGVRCRTDAGLGYCTDSGRTPVGSCLQRRCPLPDRCRAGVLYRLWADAGGLMSSTSVSVAGPMQGWGIVQTLGG